MVGEVDKDEDGVLVIQRIQVTYHLRTDPENHETAERVHSFHADSYEGDGYVIVRHENTKVVEDALRDIVQTIKVELR